MFNLAFIGSGSIAGTHAGAADAAAINIAACVDVNAASADALAQKHGATPFHSLDAFFDAVDGGLVIDGVVLCTPPSTRLSVLEKTAERGIHAMIEKPLASTVAEAEKVASLAGSKPGVVFAVGYCHRFAPAIQTMRELVNSGKVGHLIRFENTFAFHHPPMAEKWFSDPDVSGGGALMDAGCHSIDLFHFLVGPSEAAGAVLDRPWPGRGESGATALFRCTGGGHAGAAGVITAGWMEGECFEVRLVGDTGTLAYDYMAPEDLVFSPVSGEREVIKTEPHDIRFARQLAHFAVAGTDARLSPPAAGVDDGVAAARSIAGAIALAGG